MKKNTSLDFMLPMNKGLDFIWERINYLRKYLRVEGLSGRYEIAFLRSSGGLDDQEWEWLEDVNLICDIFNSLQK